MTPLPPEPPTARLARASSRREHGILLRAVGAALALVMAMTPWAEAIAPAAAWAVPASCEATDASGRTTGAAGATDGTDEAAGTVAGGVPGATTVTALDEDPGTFKNDSREVKDDLSDIGVGEFRLPARGVAVAVHRTVPSETSPRTSAARGPPVRTERLRAGAPRTHRLRPSTAGVDRPRPCEDRRDTRTARPEDP